MAGLVEVDGRRPTFAFTATDRHGTRVASGTLERTVVNRERFLARLPQ